MAENTGHTSHPDAHLLSALQERVKELTALHETARLLQTAGQENWPTRATLEALVKLLPVAWQHPDLAEARVQYVDEAASTANFRETAWMQRSVAKTGAGNQVTIEVVYLKNTRTEAEGPFLNEERNLIESLTEMLCSYFSRRESEERLRTMNEELERRVLERTQQLRNLAAELSLAEDRQRRAIASDLHDQIGQTMAMVKLRLQEIQGDHIFGSLYGQLGEITGLIDQAIRFTRTLTVELSPPILHSLGLEAALEWLGGQMKQKYGFKVILKRGKQPVTLTDDLRGALFRFVSELLVNVGKHAQATYVLVAMQQGGTNLEISVGDNGRGFDPGRLEPSNSGKQGFGLFSIKERIGYFGGTLRIESKPGAGARVTLRVPIA
jgi:signal transduction histidine kinase